MLIEVVSNYLPGDWSNVNLYQEKDYELVNLSPFSHTYRTLESNVGGSFNLGVTNIVRVQNPYLYGQYLLKKEEYETRGSVHIHELYHDTAESKIPSIVSNNLDWRLANRVKFGRGVSFSPSPTYANQQSSRSNGVKRAMIVADVLVHSSQTVYSSLTLPSCGYDTTIGNCGKVYVKFYDDEFYPKYVVFYNSREHVFRRRW